jgi:hypothetical protein
LSHSASFESCDKNAPSKPGTKHLVNKRHKVAQRIRNPSQLESVFKILGSNLNPVLTQLAKSRRAVFVEGKDFQILAKFAKKLGFDAVGNRGEFAVVPVDGFNPERIRVLKVGMETTLGGKIVAAAILDRDYRSDVEPGFAVQKKSYAMSQYLAERRRFERVHSPTMHETMINEVVLNEFEESWRNVSKRLAVIPGKEAISHLNQHLQHEYGVSLTPTAIIDAMRNDEIPTEVQKLVRDLSEFSAPRSERASVGSG